MVAGISLGDDRVESMKCRLGCVLVEQMQGGVEQCLGRCRSVIIRLRESIFGIGCQLWGGTGSGQDDCSRQGQFDVAESVGSSIHQVLP